MSDKVDLVIRWSKKRIREGEYAHIIFTISNKSKKAIVLTGYKMITRKKKIKDKSLFAVMDWVSNDPHFNIILWPRDKHEFHWNDVLVSDYYGLELGQNYTFVRIRFMQQGLDNMEVSDVASDKIEII